MNAVNGDSAGPAPSWLRDVIRGACGFDPGLVRPEDQLDDLGLSVVERLLAITAIEERHAIEFPADLVAAMETVDDLAHYTAVKLGQLDRVEPAP